MLNVYDVVINGIATTVQLTDEDARARGLTPQHEAPAKTRAATNRSRTPANKARAAAKKPAAPTADPGKASK